MKPTVLIVLDCLGKALTLLIVFLVAFKLNTVVILAWLHQGHLHIDRVRFKIKKVLTRPSKFSLVEKLKAWKVRLLPFNESSDLTQPSFFESFVELSLHSFVVLLLHSVKIIEVVVTWSQIVLFPDDLHEVRLLI
jgi:hypothetical protein